MKKKKTSKTVWKKGQSGNPGGRPRMPDDVKEAFRAMTPRAIKVLAGILDDEKMDPRVRLRAVEQVLDRAIGRPVDAVALASLALSRDGSAVEVLELVRLATRETSA